MDANHREMFYKLLLETYMEKQQTIVIATHLIEEIANLIEEIIILKNGKVIVNQPIEDILAAGYSVSGLAKDIDTYCEGKHVLGYDVLGGLKIAYIMGEVDKTSLKDTMEINPLNLQKLFVELTKKEGEI
ncbi:hypothetical protein [Absiella sp. AM54-8XD]|uniref:hypothetical protein n=1 Tax=Absiella sp. AM54-8XD TaxID=2292279 RepID=UPI001F385DBE|nr:hypothetical protein [Absiella sp. AM54-8XD]